MRRLLTALSLSVMLVLAMIGFTPTAEAHSTCYSSGGCRTIGWEEYSSPWCAYNGGPYYQDHFQGYDAQWYDTYNRRWYWDHGHTTHNHRHQIGWCY